MSNNKQIMNKFQKRKLIFTFRFLSVLDVLFADKFELNVFDKDGWNTTQTTFDKNEILNGGNNDQK